MPGIEIIGILGAVLLSVMLYNREEQLNDIFERRSVGKTVLIGFVLFTVSVIFSLQLNSCPFNNRGVGMDSSIFMYVGRQMTHGMVPYRDMFDHKGIVLYFLEYFGYLFGGGQNFGIWIIELINAFLTSVFLYRTARLFCKSEAASILSVFFVVGFFLFPFFEAEYGNITEEYALPWISISLYYVMRYLKQNEYKFRNVVLIGFGFAFVLFLRVNMVGVWIPFLLCVAVPMIRQKNYSDIIRCAAGFILGSLMVVVPILVYTLTTDSLDDMINYYILFNFKYTGSDFSIKRVILFFIDSVGHAAAASILILLHFVQRYRDRFCLYNLLFLAVAFLSSAVSGRVYPHYEIIFLPMFILPTVVCVDLVLDTIKKSCSVLANKRLVIAMCSCCVVAILCMPINYTLINNYFEESGTDSLGEYIQNNTDEDDDVLILRNFASPYITYNRSTKNKFFYQYPPIEISYDIYKEFVDELKNNPSDYIFNLSSDGTSTTSEVNSEKVLDYLDSEVQNGVYTLEDHGYFQVYVKR